MSNELNFDIIIIGAGPAGLAAAIAARENGAESLLVLEREDHLGGILQQCVHNGFGLHRFNVELTGPEYAQRDIDVFHKMGIEVWLETTVLNLYKDKTIIAISKEKGVCTLKAKAIILAMGCRERPRGALAIPGSRCSGVITAGTAQKFLNLKGKLPGNKVVILGSGDIGLIMARRMTLQGAKVLACVELMPYSSGLSRNIVQCLNDFDIPLYLSHTVIDIIGKDRLEAVIVSKVDENRKPIEGSEFRIDCDTLLLSVGLIPENELSIEAGVKISPATLGPEVDENFETNVEGIFACGNVLHVHDLVDHVSKESTMAGIAALNYVNSTKKTENYINIIDGFGVRGCVPQRISSDFAGEIELMFRPTSPFKNCTVVLVSGGEYILVLKKRVLTPGEMVLVNINEEILRKIKDKNNLKIEIRA